MAGLVVGADLREQLSGKELGTKLFIPGVGVRTAADTGGAIKGNIVDLAFMTVDECYNFGRRNMWVYFIEK